MKESNNNLPLLLLFSYIIFSLITSGNMQPDFSQQLMQTIEAAQKEARNATHTQEREEGVSKSRESDLSLMQTGGKYYKKRLSNKGTGKRYEGLFFSRGYSIYGDIDSETTTFQYGGKITKYGKRRRKYSDRDTIGSSDRYASSYIKDDFRIRAKTKKKYQRDYDGMSDMTGRVRQITSIWGTHGNRGISKTKGESKTSESQNRTELDIFSNDENGRRM
ncbi:unnamed protein product [Schistosoma rodhaini]|nr:unnamed protein product [Schistosoma rodhaini]